MSVPTRPPARTWCDCLAVAGALGLALVLWLPYLASRAFGIVHGTRLAVGLLAPLAAGVLVHWLRRGASAADPGARVPATRYRSVMTTETLRPVEPQPWQDLNRNVAPPPPNPKGQEP